MKPSSAAASSRPLRLDGGDSPGVVSWQRRKSVRLHQQRKRKRRMQQRRSATGRPTGTDGSDFSYRMVVDSRYTKVAKGKSRLCQLLLIQAVILLGNGILLLLSKLSGNAPELAASSASAILLIALLSGEYGRRRSRVSFLKIYIVLSTISTILLNAWIISNNLILQAFRGQIKSISDMQNIPIVEAVGLAGFLVQIFTVTTTVSLLSNMSLPKR
ncbi:hypothetical protein V2J09_010678 [Rumex salicifolius]